MKLLELFSGTGSVGEPFRNAGHDVVSVDINGRADITEDILQLSYCKLETPDVIWSSPPCENFSIARTRAKKPRNFALADALVSKTWEIIIFPKPKPRAVMVFGKSRYQFALGPLPGITTAGPPILLLLRLPVQKKY